MDLSRRHFLKLGSALGVSAALPACSLLKLTSKEDEYVYQLTAEPAQASLVPGYSTSVLASTVLFRLLRYVAVRGKR